jgi:hypothetical protein
MAGLTTRRPQAIALILSGVFPGLGQFYNRQHVKGGIFFVAAAALSWFTGREVAQARKACPQLPEHDARLQGSGTLGDARSAPFGSFKMSLTTLRCHDVLLRLPHASAPTFVT